MSRRADRIRYTILCEGARDYYFAKSFIEKAIGKDKTEFYRSQTVPGRGSGEQQVRNLFPDELAARRKRPKNENHWLVVITDGDGLSPKDRKTQLFQELADRLMEMPGDDEKCALFIPCRNLESWFEWIQKGNSNEEKNYKNKHRNAKPTEFGKALFEKCQRSGKCNYPHSLDNACRQWEKMR
ncbi:hypothetical protein [Desulfonatronovibrio magnus]|uniref:hypothetical protein n=1 Tax=Desulfonatronovibrio magnus TaxID=698827 RepID=UPI0005EADCF8|nr:hypothetical protein [Desulfonatronovibrio magnus]